MDPTETYSGLDLVVEGVVLVFLLFAFIDWLWFKITGDRWYW